ncbi:MAG: glycerol-3-phosphate responsive antiterminator [Lachnospiraceae bacterium]|nr:glycerol-3-phosphate responsive antiterminator [Lachnospiraceae bacterium]
MNKVKKGAIIAAVRTEEEFEEVFRSKAEVIFDLNPDLLTLAERVRTVHAAGRSLFIHLDLAAGIGKDKSGIQFVKDAGVDGVISTRVNIIKLAREAGLFTVQRFFVVDSRSVDTTVEGLKASRADMIEVMPGVVPKTIRKLKGRIEVPIIAGGLIETVQEVEEALRCGAGAVSTGRRALWNLKVSYSES